MKKIALAALVAVFPSITFAATPADLEALRAYALRALPKCANGNVTITQIPPPGPSNFESFIVRLTSSDEHCGTQKHLLWSPTTQQVILGSVLVLPSDNRPAQVRVGEHASELLRQPITATISPFPMPDGLKAVTMSKKTAYGAFPYHGFVDASTRFLIVGTRGNLKVSPGKALLDALGSNGAARRGNPKAKVTIVELSDFQCPTCARAHKNIEPIIAANLKKIDYRRIDLPLFEAHDWSLDAALAARAIEKVAPAKYWAFVDHVFENQEQITKGTLDKLVRNFAEDHEISWKAIEPIYRSTAERAALLEQVSRAFDNGINSTPTFIINGQPIGYGRDGTFTIETLKNALGVK
jgi:protein-disulfide isomerase